MNSFGRMIRVSSWGSSHGAGIGVLIDGLPAGLSYDEALLLDRLKQRQGGGLGTPRKEPDLPELLAGIENGRTTGDPVAFLVRNTNTKSADYDEVFRPAHADFGYFAKWGRALGAGGGRASARESVAKVIAGAFAAMLLAQWGVRVHAALCAVGGLSLAEHNFSEEEFIKAELNAEKFGLRALGHDVIIEGFVDEITSARKLGDSVGASVAAAVFGAPAGIGEVLYDKLDSRISQYLMNLNAVKAVEFGAGVKLASMRGSSANDEIISSQVGKKAHFITKNNYAGGILGGLSTAEPITLKAHFKPTPSITIEQTLATHSGELLRSQLRGRHDPCVGVRAVVIVRSLIELAVADFMLLNACSKLENLNKIYKEN